MKMKNLIDKTLLIIVLVYNTTYSNAIQPLILLGLVEQIINLFKVMDTGYNYIIMNSRKTYSILSNAIKIDHIAAVCYHCRFIIVCWKS